MHTHSVLAVSGRSALGLDRPELAHATEFLVRSAVILQLPPRGNRSTMNMPLSLAYRRLYEIGDAIGGLQRLLTTVQLVMLPG